MSGKYDVCVTNPPYMGSSNMTFSLFSYIKEHYTDSKNDLFAAMIERGTSLLKDTGMLAIITQQVWMFISSFEKLRNKILTHTIFNMLHLGARAFEEIGGEVVQTTAFVLANISLSHYRGTYARLINPTTQKGKEDMFLSKKNRYYSSTDIFFKIPDYPIAYWVNNKIINLFEQEDKLENIFTLKRSMSR